MAKETSLMDGLEEVEQAIQSYARRHGWAESDYCILYKINRDYGYVDVNILNNKVKTKDLHAAFASLYKHLDKELGDDRVLREAIVLGMVYPYRKGDERMHERLGEYPLWKLKASLVEGVPA